MRRSRRTAPVRRHTLVVQVYTEVCTPAACLGMAPAFAVAAPLDIYAALRPAPMACGNEQPCCRQVFVVAPRAELSDATPSRLPGNAFSAFRGFRPGR